MFPHEVEILNKLDQSQIVCDRCGATLGNYRNGDVCSADLDDPCPGFVWVENAVGSKGGYRS